MVNQILKAMARGIEVHYVKKTSFDEIGIQEWNELASKSEICDPFQTYEWVQTLKKTVNANPNFVIVKNGGKTIGGAVFLKKKLFGVFDSYEIRGGPFFLEKKGEIVVRNIIRALRKRKGKSVYVLFVPSPLVNLGLMKLFKDDGYHSVPFRTMIVNLNKPLEEIWSALDKRARWGVRKAERSGVKAEFARSWPEWREYYNLHVTHSTEKRYFTLPEIFFKEMFQLQRKGFSCLLVAKYRTKIIAGSLFLVHRENMVFLLNASLDAFLKYNPNNLIQWESIEWAKRNGVITYDMNGLPWKEIKYLRGIYDYKRRWDGYVLPYYYYLSRRLVCSGVRLVRTNFSAWKLFSRLRNYGFVQL